MEQLRVELGLPQTAQLRVEPHSLLIYGKGQFFLPHQDSEKHDEMVGTLVVSLPSAHTGGELVIDHGEQTRTYRGSKQELSLVAFYSDCRHQVRPVRSGYRATLTFNLLASTQTSAPGDGPATELAHCLTEHFAVPAVSRHGGRDLGTPNRLVYLLDHEYTERGLDWRRLKGADAERAALLRTAAEQTECDAVLALAEVTETWDVEPSDAGFWNYADDDEEADYEEDYEDGELSSLLDDEITLGWWTSPDGGGEPISLHVPDHEVCASTPSAHLEPYQSEYEGYMGNYGNTVDRWYRRAAVVVWPQDRAFTARAEAGSQWALHELDARIAAGDVDGARVAAGSLAPFWQRIAAQERLLGPALDVAAGLDAAETAAMLLEPFRVEMLAPEHAPGLTAVTGHYGEQWIRNVVDGWFGAGHRYETDRYQWLNRLPKLCEALHPDGTPEMARLLTTKAWRWMDGQFQYWTTTARTDLRQPQLKMLSSPLVGLLEAASDTLRDEITAALREYKDPVLECLLPMLRAAPTRRSDGIDEVARDCAQRLEAIIARPPRAEDDWSIEWTGCRCELCDTLRTFLRSPDRRTLEWPLKKDGRKHVHSQIDSAGLPVQHQTRRHGRPFTLVLTKTNALFKHENNARQRAVTDLAWLTSTSSG